MLSRLFKLNARLLPATLGVSALNSLLLLGACGSTFTAAPSAGGSPGTSGAGGDSSSSAGESGSSDEGGTSGGPSAGAGGTSNGGAAGTSVAGSAGKPATSCDCGSGTYCQDGTTKCVSCANFSRLSFAAPEKLSTLAQSETSIERFPRVANASSALFYASGDVGQERLWYAPTPVSGVGAPISEAARVESGPLLAPGFSEQNFFFDRLESATGKRKIMTANWTGAAVVPGSAALAPTPINILGFDDYSIAVAPGAGHAYWMSTRSGEPLLYLQAGLMGSAVPFDLKVGAQGCARTGDDATPWVNLAGTLLLFRSESVNDNCEPNDSGAYDLFAVPLAKDGSAISSAIALSSLNNTGGNSTETDPSLSQDACWIYFASDGGTGNYDLYRAARN